MKDRFGLGERDLVAAVATAVLCAVVVLCIPLEGVRLAAAVPLSLFLPGYAITAAAFGERQLEGPQLLVLSVATSLATLTIDSLILNYVPGGLRATSWAVLLVLVVLGACKIASLRRPPPVGQPGDPDPTVKPRELAFIGSARRELQILLKESLARYSAIELAEANNPTVKPRELAFIGSARLELRILLKESLARYSAIEPAEANNGLRVLRPQVRSLDRTLLVGVALAAVLAALAVGVAVATWQVPLPAKNAIGYTRLWMLPSGGAKGARMQIGVVSQEQHPVAYKLEVQVGRRGTPVSSQLFSRLVLKPGQGRVFPLRVRRPLSGTLPITALLFRRDRPDDVYRRVTGWVPGARGPL